MIRPVFPSLPYQAVICAVYGTLFERGPAPADADARWADLWRRELKQPPRLSLADFNAEADWALQVDANLANARGVENPAPPVARGSRSAPAGIAQARGGSSRP